MLVTDLSMREDPDFAAITRRWLDHPEELNEAFAKAWYKLLHRDMGPISRYLGPWIAEPQLWQDPVPAVEGELIGEADIKELKAKVLDSGLTVQQLVKTAWSSAASFRSTDKRGGANGARIRLEPQKNWEANEPSELAKVLPVFEKIKQDVRQERVAGRPDRAWRVRPRSRRRPRTPASRSMCTSRRVAPTRRRRTPMWSRSRCSSRGATGSATSCVRARRLRWSSC